MLQKLSLTILVLAAASTPFTAFANKSFHSAAAHVQRNVRAPWQYVPLGSTMIALAPQIVASNPVIAFPITCVALIGGAIIMVAPDEVKDAISYTGTQTIAGLRTMKTKAIEHLKNTDTTSVKSINAWRY